METLANMTIKNPIFMIVLFGVVWYLPGIIIRRRVELSQQKIKLKKQKEKISALYPNNNSKEIN